MPQSGARAQHMSSPPSRLSAGQREREDGFAILVVVVVLSLLAIATMILQRTVIADIRLASHLLQRTTAEALADGIARLAVRHLVVNPPSGGRSGSFRMDGVPMTCRSGASLASISFVNVDGQINLNQASQPLFERVFEGVGLAQNEGTRLALDILDFRSVGDQSLSGSSKFDAYRQAGLVLGPKSAPFQSVGELDQVVGMTPQLLERLRPLMTVHSRTGVINPNDLSVAVALALAGAGADASVDPDILKARLSLPADFTTIIRSRSTGSTISNVFLVRVTVGQGRTGRFTREAVVQLTGGEPGSTIKEWHEIDRGVYGVDPAGTDSTPACIGGLLSLEPA